jgi:hypothetical protein
MKYSNSFIIIPYFYQTVSKNFNPITLWLCCATGTKLTPLPGKKSSCFRRSQGPKEGGKLCIRRDGIHVFHGRTLSSYMDKRQRILQQCISRGGVGMNQTITSCSRALLVGLSLAVVAGVTSSAQAAKWTTSGEKVTTEESSPKKAKWIITAITGESAEAPKSAKKARWTTIGQSAAEAPKSSAQGAKSITTGESAEAPKQAPCEAAATQKTSSAEATTKGANPQNKSRA